MLVLKIVDIIVRIGTCSNEITSILNSTEKSTKLHAGVALRGNICFVFRKNAQFCWSLNQQCRLKEEEAPSRRLYGSPTVHHRVYVTSYFYTLRKSTETPPPRVSADTNLFPNPSQPTLLHLNCGH